MLNSSVKKCGPLSAPFDTAAINKGPMSNPKPFLTAAAISHPFLSTSSTSGTLHFSPNVLLPLAMATYHPNMFQQSVVDESKILKLVLNHFLPNRPVLQCRPANGDKIPTPSTKEIVVFSAFFQRGFGLPACDFFHDLHHYKN
jgi:hypothetical protein